MHAKPSMLETSEAGPRMPAVQVYLEVVVWTSRAPRISRSWVALKHHGRARMCSYLSLKRPLTTAVLEHMGGNRPSSINLGACAMNLFNFSLLFSFFRQQPVTSERVADFGCPSAYSTAQLRSATYYLLDTLHV